MIAYGYGQDGNSEKPNKLSEASLVLKKEELHTLIEFLTEIRDESSNAKTANGEHWHYRDWAKAWSEDQSDLIVFLTEES